MNEKIKETVDFIKNQIKILPDIGLILGSGLGFLAEKIENSTEISYKDIPNFPYSTVPGHEGKLVFGNLSGKNVVVLKGRFHLYEGWNPETIKFVIYTLRELGVERLLITNAAGGINRDFEPGDVVLIKDIINFQFRNPLRGSNDEYFGPRFPDMSSVVDFEWYEKVKKEFPNLKEGVYMAVLGPSYETPAEIRAFKRLGADLVGMSTVPEIIAAKHCGIKTLSFSCVTNMAAGILDTPLSHKEVVEVANRVKDTFSKIILKTLEVL
ncbi:purine nucleoside phosphorylase [Thermosipho africanus H17ap60334]|jgi:purine-nucleoside phosphorylase|uniref:Purine nucleoside phosphorylase n=1 Tax=Thermosipho africanus (strain TCF52B) TaxID=484019 RepID=B7IE58_THEAB|nr:MULTISPECIES: purine-nucleoside phosphorylase [Thermosipho]ACJ76285.1 purine nucleoside phosphorylase I, inosine and guanosine-specific [Thermosipho africanus TCF52B]EKF49227.1 purine nucleoside phosphorylase [Thermosipho africanus H17ap60334]MBZ4650422.1 purine nucleoside phosphorylase inosine and guanosine-specific [Thermosipho sp. (in: thermotogales)]MDK2840237.1 purine-nucleoside phosphorylase [Thermosipho sp. (in: thermotogales)]RDI91011.1 purine nucleoside phosphorylase [Thermosipho a